MTREEREDAINFFKEVAKREVGTYCSLAIEALEQEPCEDCISREDALMALTGIWTESRDEILSKAIRRINSMPSVTPKEKTGKWIVGRVFPTKIGDENLIEYRCSECDRAIRCTESQLVNYPYCHCGAKMVETQESEDKE